MLLQHAVLNELMKDAIFRSYHVINKSYSGCQGSG